MGQLKKIVTKEIFNFKSNFMFQGLSVCVCVLLSVLGGCACLFTKKRILRIFK